jgi:hypothetical protein
VTDELDWLAFRYVAGELTPKEAGAFEERLASDQAAREAVARAAALGMEVAEARPTVARTRGFAATVLGPLAWASLGAAASLAVWSMLQNQPRPAAREPAPQPVVTREIDAVAWIQLHGVVRAEQPVDELELDEPELPVVRGPLVPNWMLRASENVGEKR